MEAFGRAASLGYRFIETDIHVTADGVIVAIHDPTVDRTTEASGPVSAYSFEELSALDAGFRHLRGGDHPFRGQGIAIPSLEEALATFPDVSFVVDLKGEGVVGPFVDLIERLGVHQRLVVGSFSERRLAEFRRLTGGRVATSTGPAASRRWLISSRIRRPGDGQSSALQLPARVRGIRVVDKRLVDTAHTHGLQVHVWTVNDPLEMAVLLDVGVDGLITDRPDLLKDLLVTRGAWSRP